MIIISSDSPRLVYENLADIYSLKGQKMYGKEIGTELQYEAIIKYEEALRETKSITNEGKIK